MSSSFAAIGCGYPPASGPFAEDTWTEPAGQSAWDFIAREGGALELEIINPTGIFGPVLGPDYSGSIGIVKALLDGVMPRVPRISVWCRGCARGGGIACGCDGRSGRPR
jgi:dihydroflavonol-4-reductase